MVFRCGNWLALDGFGRTTEYTTNEIFYVEFDHRYWHMFLIRIIKCVTDGVSGLLSSTFIVFAETMFQHCFMQHNETRLCTSFYGTRCTVLNYVSVLEVSECGLIHVCCLHFPKSDHYVVPKVSEQSFLSEPDFKWKKLDCSSLIKSFCHFFQTNSLFVKMQKFSVTSGEKHFRGHEKG